MHAAVPFKYRPRALTRQGGRIPDPSEDGVTPPVTSPRHAFRVLTRTRTGYNGAVMRDVQLQVVATGTIVWAQTFSNEHDADRCRDEVEADLDALDDAGFRRKWSVPSNA